MPSNIPEFRFQPLSGLRRQDLRLPLRHLLVRELQGLLQADGAEQEELRLPPRGQVPGVHRHPEEVSGLPVRQVPPDRNET